MPAQAFTRAQLLAADRPAFLLTLTWGGKTYREATEILTITDADGNALSYGNGLNWPDYAEESDRSGGIADAGPSAAIEVFLGSTDVAAEVARGRWLEQAEGEIAFVLLDGSGAVLQAWEDRIRLVVGSPAQPAYADPGLPTSWCTFSLERQPYDDTASLLDPAAKVDEETWPDVVAAEANSAALGRPYPVVIGTPGISRDANGTLREKPGSPAYAVEYIGFLATRLLICAEEVVAGSVVIWEGEGGTSESFPVEHVKDGKGRLVATVDVSGASVIDTSNMSNTQFWCEWSDGGGIRNPFGEGALERLGDVLAWALLRSKTPIDLPKWMNERALLSRYNVATYLNDVEQTPWTFVTRMLERVPAEVRAGVDGAYPRARRLEVVDADLLVSITEDADFYPDGPVATETEPGDIINAVSLSYAPRARDGGYRRTTTFTAASAITDPVPTPPLLDPEIHPDAYAFASQSRFGEKGVTYEIPWLFDEATAGTLARDILRTCAFPIRTRPYSASFVWGWLCVGDIVRFTSESLSLTDAIVEITGKKWAGEGWTFVLAYDDDPVRDAGRRAA